MQSRDQFTQGGIGTVVAVWCRLGRSEARDDGSVDRCWAMDSFDAAKRTTSAQQRGQEEEDKGGVLWLSRGEVL